MRSEFLQIESILSIKGFDKNFISRRRWNQWQKAYPEVVNSLVYIYRKNDRNFDAEIVLSDWVLRNPKDTNAQEILEQIRSGKKVIALNDLAKVIPKVSIIIPHWNGIETLSECLDSIICSDFKSYEVIVSDNNSTDGSQD